MNQEQTVHINPYLHKSPKVFVNMSRDTISALFKDLPMIPAKIRSYSIIPSPFSSSLDIKLKFIYENGFDINYDNHCDYMHVNASKMGDLLRDFDISDIKELPNRDIYVFTEYLPEKNKRLVFGIIPLGSYRPDIFNI